MLLPVVLHVAIRSDSTCRRSRAGDFADRFWSDFAKIHVRSLANLFVPTPPRLFGQSRIAARRWITFELLYSIKEFPEVSDSILVFKLLE